MYIYRNLVYVCMYIYIFNNNISTYSITSIALYNRAIGACENKNTIVIIEKNIAPNFSKKSMRKCVQLAIRHITALYIYN